VSVVQCLVGVSIEDGNDRAGEIYRDSCAGKQEIENAAPTVSLRVMPAGFKSLYEEPLPVLLMDMDSIEGKLPRCDERDSNETDEMTVANILWGHGGLVTGHEKGLPGVASLEGPIRTRGTRAGVGRLVPRREGYCAHPRPTGVRGCTMVRARHP
jgi:hypothetical protein